MSTNDAQPDLHALAAGVKEKARELGFDLVGIAPASPSKYADHVRAWVASGQAGDMAFMYRRLDERTDPGRYLPGAQSVVCVAINYHVPLEPVPEAERAKLGRVARYALGRDYHEHLKDRLYDLADWIRSVAPDARTRAATDSAPVSERELAVRAGIGWVGKNTLVIHPRLGSWLLLGEVLTTVPLPPDEPIADHCGTCTRCIDACPTQAITAPYRLDATRCISYLTIEHRGEIALELRAKMQDWVFGCDVCQDVCPHNHRVPTATDPAVQPIHPTGTLVLDKMLGWSHQEYWDATRGTPMRRVKLPVLQRNAEIARENVRSAAEAREGAAGDEQKATSL